MKKPNCWEFKKCGREPGGSKTHLGICPASMENRLHGVHGGRQAGRACWIVAGTLCGGQAQGTFAQKYANCEKCDFYQAVKKDEGMAYILSPLLLLKVKGAPRAAEQYKAASYSAG